MNGFTPLFSRVAAMAWLLALTSGISAIPPQSQPASLQTVISHLMAGKPGAVVVMHVASGRILAKWRLDVAAQRLEPPGSTVKPFVLLELLSSGKANPEQRLMCRRPLFIAGRRMDCSHPESVDTLDAPNALAYSCNSYFSQVAARLENDELVKTFRRTGFTSITGLASPEVRGRVATPADPPHLQLQALGEWGIEVTPLELLAAYRSLALRKLRDDNLASAAPVFDGLEKAVRYGIAHAAQPQAKTAAGKTGTAAGTHTTQTHGFFVGYSPADKPEIAVVVYLERGRGLDAAGIAGKVFDVYWNSGQRFAPKTVGRWVGMEDSSQVSLLVPKGR